jgi:hypothetical protein
MNTEGDKKQALADSKKNIIDHFSKIKELCDSGIAQIDNAGKSSAPDVETVSATLDTIFGEIDTLRDLLFEFEELFDSEE